MTPDQDTYEGDIDALYAAATNMETTEGRIRHFVRNGFYLPIHDNYDCSPTGDPDFDRWMHRWLYMFSCTTGAERGAAMQVAFELFKAADHPYVAAGASFFCSAFSDATRRAYYAKAMSILYGDFYARLVGAEDE